MEFKAYFNVLWRQKWVIIFVVAITVIATVLVTQTVVPMYAASSTLRVATAMGGSLDYVRYDLTYADRLMNTYARFVTSRPALDELQRQLDLDKPPQIDVDILANTELIRITAEDRNPVRAQEAANALAEIVIAQSRKLDTGSGQSAQQILQEQLAQIENELELARREHESLTVQFPEGSLDITASSRAIALKEQTYSTMLEQYETFRVREAIQANALSVIEPAITPSEPFKPRPTLNLALGIVVGLIGGVALALLRENMDTTLYTAEQIEAASELSMFGNIPAVKRRQRMELLNGNSPPGQAFRRLRTNIFAFDRDASLKSLLVTSAVPKEGKSTIVASLALAIAQSGRNVVVVDSDLHMPVLHNIFDVPNATGLSNVLKQEATSAEAVQTTNIPGVHLLTSGPSPNNPSELLSSPAMTALIDELQEQFDVVLLDSPPLLAVADAVVLAPVVDGVLLVVGRAQVQQEAVQIARQQLTAAKARLIGVVVNHAKQGRNYKRYYASSHA